MTISEQSTATPAPTILDATGIAAFPWQPFRDLSGIGIKELWRTPQGVAGLMRLGSGCGETPHRHGAGDHHMWIIEGSAVVAGTRVGPGGYVHVPAGLMHAVRADDALGCTFFFVYERARQ